MGAGNIVLGNLVAGVQIFFWPSGAEMSSQFALTLLFSFPSPLLADVVPFSPQLRVYLRRLAQLALHVSPPRTTKVGCE